MARQVENVFVDVTSIDERPLLAQHQRLFPGNRIARWEIEGKTYIKVPYMAGETKVSGLTAEQFQALLPVSDVL